MAAELRLHHPFRMIVSGSSGTGKSTFVRQFLKDYRNTTDIRDSVLRVLYYHGAEQQIFNEKIAKNVDVVYNFGYSERHEDDKPHILIIDDLMSEMGDDPRLSALFTKVSHHQNLSVIFLTQNLFHKGKEMRTVSLNAQVIVAMNNPRDRQQLMTLGRQIYPGSSNFFNAVLTAALAEPFSHLMIDLSPQCPDSKRLKQRTEIKGTRGFLIFEKK